MNTIRGTYHQWLERIATRGPAYAEGLRPAVLEEADPERNLGPLLNADHPAFRAMLPQRTELVSYAEATTGGCGCAENPTIAPRSAAEIEQLVGVGDCPAGQSAG